MVVVGIVGGAATLLFVWVTISMSNDPQPADEWLGWLLVTSAAIAWGIELLTGEPSHTPPAEE
jgi:hypothetical protein